MTLVIEDAGDDDYTLLVTDDGAVEARKRVPYDGVRVYTTATRDLPTGRRTQSQYGLSVDEVIGRYLARADTATPRPDLAESVAQALREVRQEGDDAC
ncbi:hypothetical protein NDI54_05845 [Haloarcula sp. S1AR25-5A]|uniref:Uncharacterized protein n=1 Tax=Haloarcula terrestris TaxID=2950533 RepID=A0AAE4EY52_9EURY|nr:hypothetical protein [Haloarcula terrestris]MDS0220876.1 hypothetical protein [Haloarcula terrestris]